jgi:hypothetical protein
MNRPFLIVFLSIPALPRKCKQCGLPLPEKSRRNREYCPYKHGVKDYCKNEFNNVDTLAEYHENKGLKKINSTNKRILGNLLGDQKDRIVTEQQLLEAGVKVQFYLNRVQRTTTKNSVLLFLDFALEQLDNNQYQLYRHGRQF